MKKFLFFAEILICIVPLLSKSQVVVKSSSLIPVNGIFCVPEITVVPSPNLALATNFESVVKIIDYDAASMGGKVAIILRYKSGQDEVRLWQLDTNTTTLINTLDNGFRARSLCWHPDSRSLFVLGEANGLSTLRKLTNDGVNWKDQVIYTTSEKVTHLVIGPRPYIVSFENSSNTEYYTYRLFLGVTNQDGTSRIVSITEDGERFYQVLGPKATQTSIKEGDVQPSDLVVKSALPLFFHPSGQSLIFEDENHHFMSAQYSGFNWERIDSMKSIPLQDGSLRSAPNGLALLHWNAGEKGVGVYSVIEKKEATILPSIRFGSEPILMPDGKGVIAMVMGSKGPQMQYIPVELPLADVVNAWMLVSSPEELKLFQEYQGLFRPNATDQLFKLYDSENYGSGGYSRNSSARPYLVTSDIFWELFGAVYQGMFTVKERVEAIPMFWKFVDQTYRLMKIQNPKSKWVPALEATLQLNYDFTANQETKRMIAAQPAISAITGKMFDYAELTPRGNYATSSDMKRYFRGFRYLTTIFNNEPGIMKELNLLPSSIQQLTISWISCYSKLIAPSRSPLVWSGASNLLARYCEYPLQKPTLFPLSWGWDNEILNTTVYHPMYPIEQQVWGPSGGRLLPSGLDLAAAFNNGMANRLLEDDYQKYPPLRNIIDRLRKRAIPANLKESTDLYSLWIKAIADQLTDTVADRQNRLFNRDIVKVKQLQTGLATWATLRHATLLVNERSVAESGEGGFEELLSRAPRGAVEPDPAVFESIAQLFEAAIKVLPTTTTDIMMDFDDGRSGKMSLYSGIIRRLRMAANDARFFGQIAQKEVDGKELTDAENEKILYVARTAEHLFLIFNSLANKDYALSDPDPIAKIADVAGDHKTSILHAAVGNVMEWNLLMPFYGRRQIVKGAVYSYYEFANSTPISDQDWRSRIGEQEVNPWIKRFVWGKQAEGLRISY